MGNCPGFFMKKQAFDASIAYIDPANCGSTVGWTITTGYAGFLNGTIKLSDCNRSIEWSFDLNDRDGVKAAERKLQMAIAMLTRFRDRIPAARRWKQEMRRRGKRK